MYEGPMDMDNGVRMGCGSAGGGGRAVDEMEEGKGGKMAQL